MNFLCDTPYVECYVRNEFLYDQAKGQGELTPRRRYSGFAQSLLECPCSRSCWPRAHSGLAFPIHALCIAPCEPLSVDLCAWWDSYGYHAQVHAFAFLRNHRVSALGRDGQIRKGTYLFHDRLGQGWVVRNQRSAQKPSCHRPRRFKRGGQRAADCVPQ
jgi:hypothetical protein